LYIYDKQLVMQKFFYDILYKVTLSCVYASCILYDLTQLAIGGSAQ